MSAVSPLSSSRTRGVIILAVLMTLLASLPILLAFVLGLQAVN